MSDRDRMGREPEPSAAELAESVTRKLVSAIVIAGGLIGLGLWSRPGPARYQVVAAEGMVYRINTDSGTVIGCAGDRCAIVVRHGQELEHEVPPRPAPRQLAPPQPSTAPPAAAPAAPAATPAPAPPGR